jgi:hypothetical protein
MAGKQWWTVLLAARLVQKRDRCVSALALAAEAGIESTEHEIDGEVHGSKPHNIAGAWLSKFVRWGYAVKRDGRISLTDWGMKREAPDRWRPQKVRWKTKVVPGRQPNK